MVQSGHESKAAIQPPRPVCANDHLRRDIRMAPICAPLERATPRSTWVAATLCTSALCTSALCTRSRRNLGLSEGNLSMGYAGRTAPDSSDLGWRPGSSSILLFRTRHVAGRGTPLDRRHPASVPRSTSRPPRLATVLGVKEASRVSVGQVPSCIVDAHPPIPKMIDFASPHGQLPISVH